MQSYFFRSLLKDCILSPQNLDYENDEEGDDENFQYFMSRKLPNRFQIMKPDSYLMDSVDF